MFNQFFFMINKIDFLKITILFFIIITIKSCNLNKKETLLPVNCLMTDNLNGETINIFKENISLVKPDNFYVDSISPQEYIIQKQIPLVKDYEVYAIFTRYYKGESFKYAIKSYEKFLDDTGNDSIISSNHSINLLKDLKHKTYYLNNFKGGLTTKIYLGDFKELYEVIIYSPKPIEQIHNDTYCEIIKIISTLKEN